MKMPLVVVLCLVSALAGFFGGRLGHGETSAETRGPTKSTGSATAGSRGDADGKDDKAASAKGGSRSGSSKDDSTTLPDSFRNFLKAWNDQSLVLADGEEREVQAGDLIKLSQLMGMIGKADAADVAELKEVLKSSETGAEEIDTLKAMLLAPVLGRDVELRGAGALDEMIEKNAETEDDMFSDVMPMMVYTLAKQNAAEAEAWLKTFTARKDADDFTIDADELKALIQKAKKEK